MGRGTGDAGDHDEHDLRRFEHPLRQRDPTALAYVPFPVLVRGEYDVTPDHQPILGRVGDGLYVAAGFSGHGFMIAPAVARIVANAVTGAPADEALGILDVARFEENRLVPEPQLV